MTAIDPIKRYSHRAVFGYTLLAIAVLSGFVRLQVVDSKLCDHSKRQYDTVVLAVKLAYEPVSEKDLHLDVPLTAEQRKGLKDQNRINAERRDFVLKGLGHRPSC